MKNRYNHSKAKTEEHPQKRSFEKCPLDLKAAHKYIPEKRYWQDLDKIIQSNVTQRYDGWKKIPNRDKALTFYKSYKKQQQIEEAELTEWVDKDKKARENRKEKK